MNYTVGFFDAPSRLKLQYFLSPKWTVQAEAGDESSGDFLYTIDR